MADLETIPGVTMDLLGDESDVMACSVYGCMNVGLVALDFKSGTYAFCEEHFDCAAAIYATKDESALIREYLVGGGQ